MLSKKEKTADSQTEAVFLAEQARLHHLNLYHFFNLHITEILWD